MTKTTVFTLSVTLALTVATPTITPNGGNFSSSVSVVMQTATSGASIYYTMDGSTPTQSSIQYTGAMTLASNATVNAKAFKSGANPSAVASASFVKNSTGNTYYVATGGSDSSPGTISQPFRSIKKGVSVLKAGDTVYIRTGTYYENLDSNRDVIPSGTSWNNSVTIAAYPGEAVTMAFASPTDDGLINIATSDLNPTLQYIIVDGIIFDGTNVINGKGAVGVGFSDGAHTPANHIRFSNVEVKNTSAARLDLAAGAGFMVAGDSNEFINCNVHDNGRKQGVRAPEAAYGFYIGGSNHLVEKCKIHHNGGYGLHVYTSSGGVNNNIVRYNEVYENGLEAGQVVAGILLSSGAGNRAYGNLVWSTLNKNNLIGINISSSCSNCLVYNNTVVGFQYFGITTAEGLGSPGAIVRNNIAYQNGTNLQASGSGTIVDHNLLTNPLFIDLVNANFGLQQGSAAINTGTASIATGITLTYNGVAPDIGAMESSW